MKIGIGIDTGGTCTDAVAYDFETGTFLAKGKSLTTRENLSIGIGKALDMIPQEYIRDALMVSLSTTLATNACLEDKGGRAKLMIFGLTDELITRYDAQMKYGLKSGYVHCVDTSGSADGLTVTEPDWDSVLSEHGDWLRDADALSAAELYSMNNGAPCENRVKKMAEEIFSLPCVCASEFTNELDVLVRGATAMLNARMFPIVNEFVEAAISDFQKRRCKAPVMVVRSDGSMMSSDLSRSRPVETILSGPAASVLAGKTFCEEKDYVIVDMGGTTTDISVVRGGRPVMARDGIQIGGWKTAVKGVYVSPFALGGDTTVRLINGKPQLTTRRATSMCSAARRWPEIKQMLINLIYSKHVNRFPLHEIFYLVREPAEQKSYSRDELALLDVLRDGPCILEKLQEKAGIDLYHFNGERLEAEGIVMRCGLTPTDFMHLRGDYNEYDKEASQLAAQYMLFSMKRENTPEEMDALVDEVYDLVGGQMYENLLRVMLSRQHPAMFKDGADAQTEYLIKQAWADRGMEGQGFFRHAFGTNAALVGIGAPTHVFLPAVAKALGAQCILPENAEVANALGALMADIDVVSRVEISQRLASNGGMYYIAHAPTGSKRFDNLSDAIEMAKAASAEAAVKEARSRGAAGDIEVNTIVEKNRATTEWGADVSLGSAVISEVTVRLG